MAVKEHHVMPRGVLPEAWQAAVMIDEELAQWMGQRGLVRTEGQSKMIDAIAMVVQRAICDAFARMQRDLRGDPKPPLM